MGSSQGAGYVIAQAEGVFDTTGAFAGLTVLAIGVVLMVLSSRASNGALGKF
jgi:NitT/TauT family transport system permease protein